MEKDILDHITRCKVQNSKSLDLTDFQLKNFPIEVCNLTSLRVLRLKKNYITRIPKEISNLKNLIELNLTDNLIDEIPEEVTSLPKLQMLFLGMNKIKTLPVSLEKFKNLKVLNLKNNSLQILPEDIYRIEQLNTLLLQNNSITRLPNSLGHLITLNKIMLEGNPIEYPPKEIIDAGLMRIMLFLLTDKANQDSSTEFTLNLPKAIRTAVKQYLTYFSEYVEISKGKTIYFEVFSNESGITIKTPDSENLSKLNEYFNEYLSFVKSNIDELVPKIEVPLDEPRKNLFILELKSQVQHLKQQIDFKNFQLNYLEKQVENFQNIFLKQSTVPIIINTSATSHSQALLVQQNNMQIEFKEALPKLYHEIFQLKSKLPLNISESIKEELSKIDEELLSNEEGEIEQIDKKPFRRIRRIFDQFTEKDSELRKIVDKSKDIKETLQKVGKSYNQIAQWLALPVIPQVLLDI